MSILYVLKIAKREVHMCSVSIPYHRLQFSIFHTCPKIYNSSNWEGEACYVICWNSPPLLRVSRDLCPWVGELSRDTSISLYVISCQGGGRWVKEELGSSDLQVGAYSGHEVMHKAGPDWLIPRGTPPLTHTCEGSEKTTTSLSTILVTNFRLPRFCFSVKATTVLHSCTWLSQ